MEEKVYRLLEDFRHVDRRTPDARLTEDLGFDKTDLSLFALSLEAEFGVSLPDPSDARGYGTVADICAMVAAALSARCHSF